MPCWPVIAASTSSDLSSGSVIDQFDWCFPGDTLKRWEVSHHPRGIRCHRGTLPNEIRATWYNIYIYMYVCICIYIYILCVYICIYIYIQLYIYNYNIDVHMHMSCPASELRPSPLLVFIYFISIDFYRRHPHGSGCFKPRMKPAVTSRWPRASCTNSCVCGLGTKPVGRRRCSLFAFGFAKKIHRDPDG